MVDITASVPRKLKLAFVGGAWDSAVGRTHRVAVEMDQRFELVAGCFSRHAEANRATAEKYRVAPERTHASLDELLTKEKGRVDALLILTPTDQHAGHLAQCFASGIPVICEKALVTSLEEADAVHSALAEQGFLAVTYNYTGYPMLREIKRMVAQGRFGRIEQVHLEMPQEGFARTGQDGRPLVPQSWRLHDHRVPTISLDLGVHLHSIMHFLTGEQPEEVVALSNTYGNFEQIVDDVSCIARYSNGIACNLWYSKTALGYRNGLKLRIFGDKGSAEWVQEQPEIIYMADNRGNRMIVDRASSDIQVANQPRYTRFKAGHPAGFIEAFANYYYDVADVLLAHLDGQPSDNEYVFGIREARQGIQMLEAIAASSRHRCWTPVA
ncbi:MAG TPA: Gfo/Idh/MocA family oxidoreductase [Rhodocyclaceae bacterium]